MDKRHIFLDHFAALDQSREFGGGRFDASIDHNTAHVLVQTMQGEDLTTKLLSQQIGDFMLRVLMWASVS